MIENIMQKRPEVLHGQTYLKKGACGNLYVTINEGEDDKPFEVFIFIGKGGGCASGQCEAIGRLISWGLRSGACLEGSAKQLKGMVCHMAPKGSDGLNCADAVGKVMETYLGKEVQMFVEENLNKEE